MTELGILTKEEVIERKRPYFRYSLRTEKIMLELNLKEELKSGDRHQLGQVKIREKKNAGMRFTLARNGQYFSYLAILIGKGRQRTEKRISLTTAQGKFLYNLPFPDGVHLSLEEIRLKSGIDRDKMPEIKDLIEELINHKVIDQIKG